MGSPNENSGIIITYKTLSLVVLCFRYLAGWIVVTCSQIQTSVQLMY